MARSARGGDAAGVHRAPHVEVVLRILADRRAGAVDGLVRAPLPGVLARRLETHRAVHVVRYPGFGGLLSFDVMDGQAARRVETATRLIANATSLGGADSVLESRHRWEGDRVPTGLLRLSVGLEEADALWADLEQALDQV